MIFFPLVILAQNNEFFNLDSLPSQGIAFDVEWKWHAGDSIEYSSVNLDDSHWEKINPGNDIDDLPEVRKSAYGWFRIHLKIDTSIRNTIISLVVKQVVASEFYQDGHFIGGFGKISKNLGDVISYSPFGYNTLDQVIHLYTGDKRNQVLAIRYALQPLLHYSKNARNPINHFLLITLFRTDPISFSTGNDFEKRGNFDATLFDYFKAGLFFILCLLHFWFYSFFIRAYILTIFSQYFLYHIPRKIILVRDITCIAIPAPGSLQPFFFTKRIHFWYINFFGTVPPCLRLTKFANRSSVICWYSLSCYDIYKFGCCKSFNNFFEKQKGWGIYIGSWRIWLYNFYPSIHYLCT
ncbi:MAG: hypothetical protein ABI168_04040 [Ginsengibacter sp.]